MQTFVLGKSYSARELSDLLSLDKNNIVFNNSNPKSANKIDINPNNPNELKDFIEANEINLLIVADPKYMTSDFTPILNETECLILAPIDESKRLVTSTLSGLKFAYKNKINTLKFAAFEKAPVGIEYVQNSNMPLVIMPDTQNEKEAPYIAESKDKAKKRVENLFQTGNKRIIIEDYIKGIDYTKYIVSDGSYVKNLFDCVTYFDELSTNNTKFIKESEKERIENEIIPVFLNSFMEEGFDYRGILGLNFRVNNDDIYFRGFSPFIEDIHFCIFKNTAVSDIKDLFLSALNGNLYDFKYETNDLYVIVQDSKGEFLSSKGSTISRAVELAEIEGMDLKLIEEGFSYWKR